MTPGTTLLLFFQGSGGPTPASDPIYFAPSYFAGSYFAPSYFPGIASTTPVVTSKSLIDAIRAWWLTVPELGEAFPGGWHYDGAQKIPSQTFVAVCKPGHRREYGTSDTEIYMSTIEFRVYGATDDASEDATAVLMAQVIPEIGNGESWQWQGGMSGPAVLLTNTLKKTPSIRPGIGGRFYNPVQYQVRELIRS